MTFHLARPSGLLWDVSDNNEVCEIKNAAMMSGVQGVLAKIPPGEEKESEEGLWDEKLQVIWILVLSQHLPHVTAAKP